ncbi:MAG: PKD domain-containing protein, partial [Chlorobi bacterium]|nr:PKD domain-containing protein [Chlorobiota bacterium]
MRKLTLLLFVMVLGFTAHEVLAQKNQVSQKTKNQFDTRRDNMGYWMEGAEKGLVPYNPKIQVKPAQYHGSQLNVKGVSTLNSPDVPVTNQTDVTESENSIFVDPNDFNYVLNSNNSTSWSGGSVGTLYGTSYLQSADGGLTFGGSVQGAGGANSGDPAAAINLSSRQFIGYISSSGGMGVSYSDDGTNWTAKTVYGAGSQDKNHLWVDNSPTSPYKGNLYNVWTDFGSTNTNEIVFSRSTDNGNTWSSVINISSAVAAGNHNQGCNVQTGPNGEVYITWSIYDSWPSDETAIGFAKSTDGGATFAPATRIISNIKGIRNSEVSKNHRVNSFPSMAVDISGGGNNGNIYIVWTNIGIPGTNTGTNRSVYMIRSTNSGTSWATPVRVNQGPFTDGKEAYFPWITCDGETGTIATVFYDDRNTTSASCETFSAYSLNAGNTWTDFVVSDVSFTPSAIPGLAGGYMGDYLAITSKGGKIYPCWTDNRGGLYMTYVSPYELGLNAQFSADATEVCNATAITFTDNSSGSPTSWIWSFPGGSPSSFNGQNPPAISYSSSGSYSVTLTVGDGTDTDTEIKTDYISVKNVIAGFSGTPTTVVVGNTVAFTDNSSCGPTSWTWSFPGGTPSTYTGQNPPAIQYDTEGIYSVTLAVSNTSGSDSKTLVDYITV